MNLDPLADEINAIARLTGTFTLRSGQIATEYFDKYRFEAQPELLARIAAAMAPMIPANTEVLAGLEMGGIPIATAPQMVGNEALAITAQMPTGVPIATVGVDAAVNAAILAAQILGVGDEEVQAKLWKFKDDLAEGLKL